MAIIIDGKKIAQDIRMEIRDEALELKAKTGIVPGLAVILVGEDPASKIYVGRKEDACKDAGFGSREYRLPADVYENELTDIIGDLNLDKEIHGILVQLPLPGHINPNTIIEAIDPGKDVDGFIHTISGVSSMAIPATGPAPRWGFWSFSIAAGWK
jgi:methenyltetrahydrofolate cyclohydrolase (EC 3.5.4.9)/5,10-methylenetetrahydrofolate dehydrogenase (NADP+) (EC 1.5.1.5)